MEKTGEKRESREIKHLTELVREISERDRKVV